MTRTRARFITAAIALGLAALPILGLVGLYFLVSGVLRAGDVAVPYFPTANWAINTASARGPVQGWTARDARRYHHLSQGTVVLPAAWFRALEQPMAAPFPAGRFADRSYLRRFGFNYDEVPVTDGVEPDDVALPIGFALEPLAAPYAGAPWDFARQTTIVGLTCAACHTGRIDLKTDGIVRSALIEGGGAMIDLQQFQMALAKSLFETQLFPERFRRFADRIAERPDGADADREAIRRQLKGLIDQGTKLLTFSQENRLIPVEAGFGRTDALDLIGNRVFGVLDDQNQSVINAPVNFPHLWDTSWFDWVQYNASIRTPMARNIGEALGVMALFRIGDPDRVDVLGKVQSSVNVPNLAWMEDLLGGAEPLTDPDPAPDPDPAASGSLQPPRWNDVMVALAGLAPGSPLVEPLAINPALAGEGKALYKQHCQHCHLPPRDELRRALRGGADPGMLEACFTPPDWRSGKRFLKLRVVDLDAIGTDPNQALNFYRRVVVGNKPFVPPGPNPGPPPRARPLQVATIPAKTGLYQVTSLIRARKYREAGVFDDPDRLLRYDRYRSVPEDRPADGDKTRWQLARDLDVGDPAAIEGEAAMGDVIQAPLGYKARPLDGVWATPPFLHNGSVPTLDDLLQPPDQRPSLFYTGSTRFDPVKVGYETTQFPGATRYDAREPGNRNAGHEFRDLTLAEMVAASRITLPPGGTDDQRRARLLGLSDQAYADLEAAAIRDLIRKFPGWEDLVRPDAPPIKGRLGPSFTDRERASLLDYLKSI